MKVLCIFLTVFSAFAQIQTNALINQQKSEEGFFKKQLKNLRFNYYSKAVGPTLSGTDKGSVSYNRFKTGQSFNSDNFDGHANMQVFQSFTFGYQLDAVRRISFTHSFQDDGEGETDYEYYRWDNKKAYGTRMDGYSENNQRISLFVMQEQLSRRLGTTLTLSYDMPTSLASKANGMTYGVGVHSGLFLYSDIQGLSYSLFTSIERDYYKTEEFYPDWCRINRETCITQYQTLRASISPSINYMLSDTLTLRQQLVFDWDQDGKINNEFNNNMNDIFISQASFRIGKGMYLGAGVEGRLENPSVDTTAIFSELSLFI